MMICAWQELLNILPLWLRSEVSKDGSNLLQEIRLRLGQPPELRWQKTSKQIGRNIVAQDLQFVINTASKYSPWTAETAEQGYITAPGGHRIGICGNVRKTAGSVTDIASISSLCIRIARDFPGIARQAVNSKGSILIIGRPGSGKTTFLRDAIRQRSIGRGETVSVVDERSEIFPRSNGNFCFTTGKSIDILSGCSKAHGINSVLRSMNPDTIAVDEITAKEDCEALFQAGWCGVDLLATAHAGSREDLHSRPLYKPLIENHLFDTLVILNRDKTWRTERLNL